MPAIIVDPALQAEVIRQFNLRGELSPFNLTENVVPIFDIGQLLSTVVPTVVTTLEGSQGVRVGTLTKEELLGVIGPEVDVADVVDGGTAINPGALTVLADTGVFGNLDTNMIRVIMAANVPVDFRIEYRNAANAATLASWTILCGGASTVPFEWSRRVDSTEAAQRVRVLNIGAVVGTVSTTAEFHGLSGSIAS